MTVLADGRVLATDPANQKVLVFAADGTPLTPYDMPKEGRSAFSRPVGITSDGTSVIIVDSGGSVARKIPLAEVAK